MDSDGLRIGRAVVVPERELAERFSRSSGPGGQGVNTADSRVELSYDVARSPSLPEATRARMLARLEGRLVDGVVTVAASEHRTQLANRRAARERMAALLTEAAAPPPRKRRPTKPSRAGQAAPSRREEAAVADQAGPLRPLGLTPSSSQRCRDSP